MDQEHDTAETEANDAAVARATLKRIEREERLLEQAEGPLWLQYLQTLALVVFGLLWFLPSIREVLLVVWFVAPIVLIQAALWSSGRRIDAVLALVRRDRID